MAGASAGVPQDPGASTSSRPGDSTSPRKPEKEKITLWEAIQEWLVPSTTFAKSATPEKDLVFARWAMGIFYVCLLAFLIYTGVRICLSGRIEMFANIYKIDQTEAPSLAFCPFNTNESLTWQGATPWVGAIKSDLHGSHWLSSVHMTNCSFDRECGCVDLSRYRLVDSAKEQHLESHRSMVFREAVEVRTNVTDPSPARVLKVGIYDSTDLAPDFFYVDQGAMFVAQLELTIWTIVDVSFQGLVNTFKGDLRAMVKNKHIYRYTSQEVGVGPLQNHGHGDTAIRLEMKTFFVEETMSSHRAFSLYTVGVLLALIALRWVFVETFYMALMPEWSEKKAEDAPPIRELTSISIWIRDAMCCSCCLREDDPSERDPLLKGKGSAEDSAA